MARYPLLQASFAGGELSPRLYGRTDIAKYGTGAEIIENFIVRPEGGLMRRHGTRYAGDAKSFSAQSRLVSFIFSTEQAYIIEFGNLYIRFWRDYGLVTNESNSITGVTKANPAVVTYSGTDNFANGDRVIITSVAGMTELNGREFEVANVNTGANTFQLLGVNSTGYTTYTSGGTAAKVVQVTTAYTTAELSTLSFAQSADTLWIAHENHIPATLTRTSDVAWTLADIDLANGPFTSLNTDTTKSVLLEISGTNYDPGDTGTMRASNDMFTADDVGSYFYIEEQYYSDKDVSPWESDKATGTTLGGQVSSNGHVYELANAGVGANTGTVAPSHTTGEAWDGNNTGADHRKKWRYLHSRFVIVQVTAYTDAQTVTVTLKTRCPNGLDPDTVSINGTNSGTGGIIDIETNSAHGFGLGDWVRVNNVAGTTEANGNWRIRDVATTEFGLEGSTYVNAYSAGSDTAKRYASYKWRRSAFSDSRGYPRAVTLHEQRLCWAGTTLEPYGVWMSRSGDFYNHLPGTRDDDAVQYNIAAPQVNVIQWLESSDNLLMGTVAQEFAAFGGGLGDPITPTNVRVVPQSTEGSTAVQPVRAANEVVFLNRAARKIFALDFDVSGGHYFATDLTELAPHLTAIGTVFTRIAWARNPSSVLWALRSDGVLCSLTYKKDQQIWGWARHPLSDGTIESIAVIPSPDGTNDDLWMIVNRTVDGSTRRYVEYLALPFEPTSPTDKDSMGFVDSGLNYSGTSTSTLSGLFHLEGKTVKVIADGALRPDVVVSGGRITLTSPCTKAWVGLGYTSRLRTLRAETTAADGTIQGRTKRVSRTIVRVLNSLAGKVSDPSETVRENLIHRSMNDLMDTSPPLQTGDFEVNLHSDYETDGRIVVVQEDPLPLDILTVTPGVTFAGT